MTQLSAQVVFFPFKSYGHADLAQLTPLSPNKPGWSTWIKIKDSNEWNHLQQMGLKKFMTPKSILKGSGDARQRWCSKRKCVRGEWLMVRAETSERRSAWKTSSLPRWWRRGFGLHEESYAGGSGKITRRTRHSLVSLWEMSSEWWN